VIEAGRVEYQLLRLPAELVEEKPAMEVVPDAPPALEA
jgi:hypothetical protein